MFFADSYSKPNHQSFNSARLAHTNTHALCVWYKEYVFSSNRRALVERQRKTVQHWDQMDLHCNCTAHCIALTLKYALHVDHSFLVKCTTNSIFKPLFSVFNCVVADFAIAVCCRCRCYDYYYCRLVLLMWSCLPSPLQHLPSFDMVRY